MEGGIIRLLVRPGRAFAAAFAVTLAALVAASPAQAHSTLIATEPARDATVEQSPDQVLLRFDEAVETAVGSLAVYDGEGTLVSSEEILRPSGPEVAVAIPEELERGTYTVAWRVISADSDPINGAWVFHVQAPGPQPSGVAGDVLEDTPFTVSAAYLSGRFFDFLMILLCVGGIIALAFTLGAASQLVRMRLLRALRVFGIVLAVVVLFGIVFQGAVAGGLSLREAFKWDVFSSVAFDTTYGNFSLVRIALGLAVAALATVLLRRGGRMTTETTAAGIAIGLALIVTPGFSGHARTEGPVAIVADATHVLAASVWVGGLAFLVAALVMTTRERWSLAADAVPRFSITAVGSVTALIVAGTVNGYLQVRVWRGLWETQYGVLLLIKVGLILPLLAFGAYNNRNAVPRLRAEIASAFERRRFLRFVGAELAIMAVIIGVTAGLVNAEPPRTQLVMMHEPSEQQVEMGPFRAHVMVTPATAGSNEIHMEFMGAQPDEVKVSATLPERQIGPLRLTAKPGGGHGANALVVRNANLAPPGDWQLRIEARRGEFDLYTKTITVPIEEASR
jgi:copper transport protein